MNLVLLLHPFFHSVELFFVFWIANLKAFLILDESHRSIHPMSWLLRYIFWSFSLKLVWRFFRFFFFFLILEFMLLFQKASCFPAFLANLNLETPCMKLSLPFSHFVSVVQRIILFCYRLSDPCHCMFLYSTLI